MKIGYPCINRTVQCRANRTFRLKSYSEGRLIETVQNNLDCLLSILQFNVEHDILFFRITSDIVPFASHPVCQFDWRSYFSNGLAQIGNYIRSHGMRISMHPGQYTILNSLNDSTLENSIRELEYHAELLDALNLDSTAKMQIHVGGVFGYKPRSIQRFMKNYDNLSKAIKKRLVVENDDRSYNLQDCIQIYQETGVPVLLDVLHQQLNNAGESIIHALSLASQTWQRNDGIPMIDYSCLNRDRPRISHVDSIDIKSFQHFITETRKYDFDIMLEIKDKEISAIKAVDLVKEDIRFSRNQQ